MKSQSFVRVLVDSRLFVPWRQRGQPPVGAGQRASLPARALGEPWRVNAAQCGAKKQ